MGSPFFCQREQDIHTSGAGGAKPEPFHVDAVRAGMGPLEGEEPAATEVDEAAAALRIGAPADHRTCLGQVFASDRGFPVTAVNVVSV